MVPVNVMQRVLPANRSRANSFVSSSISVSSGSAVPPNTVRNSGSNGCLFLPLIASVTNVGVECTGVAVRTVAGVLVSMFLLFHHADPSLEPFWIGQRYGVIWGFELSAA